eukprot:15459131-Alexandrium_andersonii.AAC.1
MQSAIRSRPDSAAILLNPQSAKRTLHYRFRRSELELRGPRNCLDIGSQSSRGVHSAHLFVLIPNPPMKA